MSKRVAAIAVLALLLSACGNQYSLPESKRLTVVATAYPLFEAAASIGGTRVHAIDLLPLDPFGPLTAEQKTELQSADLVLTLGKATQPEVDQALKDRTKPTVAMLDQFQTQYVGNGTVDPYVWQNPQNMIAIEATVRDQLIKMDPAGSPMFTKYAINLRKDLNKLDSTFIKTVATCKSKDVVAFQEDRFGYLTSHYGLKYTRVEQASDLPIAIKHTGANTIFESSLPSLSVAKETDSTYGVKVATLDPIIGQTDQARRGGANYTDTMSLNFAALKGALGCAASVPSTK